MFRVDEPIPGTSQLLTTVLHVDAYEAPMRWHASAAIQVAPQIFLPFHECDHAQRRLMAARVIELLTGVGHFESRTAEAHPFSLHGFVYVNDAESVRIAQRRQVLPDYVVPMGHIDTITMEEAIDGYGFNPNRTN